MDRKQVSEALRCNPTAFQPAVFRMDAHLERFRDRARVFGHAVDVAGLAQSILEKLESHNFDSAHIRLVATPDAVSIDLHDTPHDADEPALFVAIDGRWIAEQRHDNVARLTLVTLLNADVRELTDRDLLRAEEAFSAGLEIKPLTELRGRALAAGPLTRKAQEIYRAAVRGEIRGYEHWLTHVGRLLV